MHGTVAYRHPVGQAPSRAVVGGLPRRRANVAGMAGPTDLDPIVSAYLAEWLRRALKAESARSLAQRIGVTHATVSMVARDLENAGTKILLGVSRVEAKAPHEIEADAAAWALNNPPPKRIARDDGRPTLDRIPGYAEVEAAARARAPYLPAVAWEKTRAMSGAALADLTPELLVGFATTWAQVAAGRLRELPPDEGAKPPPVTRRK